ncbi:hypothetical protein [Mucilaginibacter sp.]|uniref:hypothetical protein n=1 Tax=Mucilaginibacter sp. TaxID=1882438 RepID=UPI0025F73D9E|nr:hypothetical protein [Mucilaginibacter sp.]
MIVPHKGFSYKLAFVGAIVGISIGLGMLSLSTSIVLGSIMAFIFGFKEIELPVKKK